MRDHLSIETSMRGDLFKEVQSCLTELFLKNDHDIFILVDYCKETFFKCQYGDTEKIPWATFTNMD